jgi:hypothetical protein
LEGEVKMEAVRFTVILLSYHNPALCHNPDDLIKISVFWISLIFYNNSAPPIQLHGMVLWHKEILQVLYFYLNYYFEIYDMDKVKIAQD